MDYALLQKIYNIKSFVGYTDEEIKELKEGFESIPHTLYEIWKKCGKTSELFNHSNDPWVTLDFQRRYKWTRKTKGYFYILNENQGVYQVAIRRADMAEDDPPVYVVETDEDGTVNEVGRAENSLSAFMMGMLIYEAAISCFEFCAEDIIWYYDGDILGQVTIGVGDWWYAVRIEHFIRQGKIKVVEDLENKYARLIKGYL